MLSAPDLIYSVIITVRASKEKLLKNHVWLYLLTLSDVEWLPALNKWLLPPQNSDEKLLTGLGFFILGTLHRAH